MLLAANAHAETAMVTDVGGVTEVVLAPFDGEAPRSARVAVHEGVWVVRADAAERELPAALPARPGERVRVFDASGATCLATLGHAEIVTVGADGLLEMTAARPDNWGPDPAERRRADTDQGAAARAR